MHPARREGLAASAESDTSCLGAQRHRGEVSGDAHRLAVLQERLELERRDPKPRQRQLHAWKRRIGGVVAIDARRGRHLQHLPERNELACQNGLGDKQLFVDAFAQTKLEDLHVLLDLAQLLHQIPLAVQREVLGDVGELEWIHRLLLVHQRQQSSAVSQLQLLRNGHVSYEYRVFHRSVLIACVNRLQSDQTRLLPIDRCHFDVNHVYLSRRDNKIICWNGLVWVLLMNTSLGLVDYGHVGGAGRLGCTTVLEIASFQQSALLVSLGPHHTLEVSLGNNTFGLPG